MILNSTVVPTPPRRTRTVTPTATLKNVNVAPTRSLTTSGASRQSRPSWVVQGSATRPGPLNTSDASTTPNSTRPNTSPGKLSQVSSASPPSGILLLTSGKETSLTHYSTPQRSFRSP